MLIVPIPTLAKIMLKLSKLALAIALGTTSSLSQASEIDDLQKQLQLLKEQMQQLQSKLDAPRKNRSNKPINKHKLITGCRTKAT